MALLGETLAPGWWERRTVTFGRLLRHRRAIVQWQK